MCIFAFSLNSASKLYTVLLENLKNVLFWPGVYFPLNAFYFAYKS